MKQSPWIPAPCKAAGKRFSKGNSSSSRHHRRISIRNLNRPEEKLFIGDIGRSTFASLTSSTSKTALDRFADWSTTNGQRDERIVNVESNGSNGDGGDLRLFDSLPRIKLLYLRAKESNEALKTELSLCKDELFRLRTQLDSEKDSRRSAENRLEAALSGLRELERVVDAQKEYIHEVRFARNIEHGLADANRIDVETRRVPTNVGRIEEKRSAKESHEKIPKAPKRNTGTMTKLITTESSVQTNHRRGSNHEVERTDRSIQTSKPFANNAISDDQPRENVGRADGDSRSSRTNRAEPKNNRGRFIDGNNGVRFLDQKSDEESSKHKSTTVGDDEARREYLKQVLKTLEKVEEEVGDLRRRFRRQNAVNGAMKQYFRTLESSYGDLFS